MFAIVFSLLGVASVGVALGIVGEMVVKAQEEAASKLKEEGKKRMMAMIKNRREKAKDSDAIRPNNEQAKQRTLTLKQQTLLADMMLMHASHFLQARTTLPAHPVTTKGYHM